MKISRRESMRFSVTALAGWSFGQLGPNAAAAQGAPQPDGLVDTQLRSIQTLPLKPDGSAVEFAPQEAGAITLLEPLLNPIWAYLVSPATETPPPTTYLGGALILGALAWRYWPRNKPA